MAAVTITPANIQLISGDVDKGTAGEVLTIGQVAYFNDTDGKWWRAKANGNAAEAGASNLGIVFSTAAAANQQITLIKDGATVAFGAGIAAGTSFFVSGLTPGGFGPAADQSAGMRQTYVGVGVGSNQLFFKRVYNGGAVV